MGLSEHDGPRRRTTGRGGAAVVPGLVAVGLLAALAIGLLPYLTGPQRSEYQPMDETPIAIVGADSLQPAPPPTGTGATSSGSLSARATATSPPPPTSTATPTATPSTSRPSTRPPAPKPANTPSVRPSTAPPSPRPSTAPPKPSSSPRPAELTPLPASAERRLRSVGGGAQTYVEFRNTRAHPVVIHWIGYDGRRRQYAVLDPGQTRRQHTYVGHPWVVTTVRGYALACFQPEARTATAVIG
ncbi:MULTISPECIES: VHL beta domain-containing protein [Micromonospora]|uniref:VHL beta domain-containing protein n=1 Tax=Micromonospora TaxID=1873 RepID=UPI001E4CC7AF|nr:hypothetical protein [Micromonospora yangpuensis]